MMKAFSVASWNVRHFRGQRSRIQRVVQFLREQNPDIFALYEVSGREVFGELSSRFPRYTFQITEGPQTQEILIGVRDSLTAFITQKVQFKSGTTHMRPGLLVTITIDGMNYCLLFLHLASSTNPRGMGLRDDMITRATKFRKVLDEAAGGTRLSNYIFLGDLNTMGLEYPYDRDIGAKLELRRADSRASRYYGMRRLAKTYAATWSGGSQSRLPDSNLDHVYASKNLSFRQYPNEHGVQKDVDVRGWVKYTGLDRDRWLNDYSDHALLYFEVQQIDQDDGVDEMRAPGPQIREW